MNRKLHERLARQLPSDWPSWAIDALGMLYPQWMRLMYQTNVEVGMESIGSFGVADVVQRDLARTFWKLMEDGERRGGEAEDSWWDRFDNAQIENEGFFALDNVD